MPQQQSNEFIRRKSSGSSVNSNASTTIEPHIYEFQESERHADSSLVIRFVKLRKIFTFYLHNRNALFMRMEPFAWFMVLQCRQNENDTEITLRIIFSLKFCQFRIPSYSHIAACSDASQKLQSNSTFYRFARLLNNNKQLPLPSLTTTAGDERRTSWDKR